MNSELPQFQPFKELNFDLELSIKYPIQMEK